MTEKNRCLLSLKRAETRINTSSRAHEIRIYNSCRPSCFRPLAVSLSSVLFSLFNFIPFNIIRLPTIKLPGQVKRNGERSVNVSNNSSHWKGWHDFCSEYLFISFISILSLFLLFPSIFFSIDQHCYGGKRNGPRKRKSNAGPQWNGTNLANATTGIIPEQILFTTLFRVHWRRVAVLNGEHSQSNPFTDANNKNSTWLERNSFHSETASQSSLNLTSCARGLL